MHTCGIEKFNELGYDLLILPTYCPHLDRCDYIRLRTLRIGTTRIKTKEYNMPFSVHKCPCLKFMKLLERVIHQVHM